VLAPAPASESGSISARSQRLETGASAAAKTSTSERGLAAATVPAISKSG
jgi:hypothetical protein